MLPHADSPPPQSSSADWTARHRRTRKGHRAMGKCRGAPATLPRKGLVGGRRGEEGLNQAPRPVEEPRRPSHSPSPHRRSALSRGAPCCAARRTHRSGPTGHRGATGIDQPVPSGKQRVTQQCEVMMLTLLDHPLSTAYRRNPILGGTNAPAKARQARFRRFLAPLRPSRAGLFHKRAGIHQSLPLLLSRAGGSPGLAGRGGQLADIWPLPPLPSAEEE